MWTGKLIQCLHLANLAKRVKLKDKKVDINGSQKIDSSTTKHCVAYDADSEEGIFLFSKVSKRVSMETLSCKSGIGIVRKFSKESMVAKPEVGRGKTRDSTNTGYKIYGTQVDYAGKTGRYTFKKRY